MEKTMFYNTTPCDEAINKENYQHSLNSLNLINPIDAQVIKLRLGLNPQGKKHTYAQCGKILNFCGERARAREGRGLRRLVTLNA